MWFALGFRLADKHREWVRHDLTDAGWRGRMMFRHLLIVIPICAALALLPGDAVIRTLVPALAFLSSMFTAFVYSDELRAVRLRQHGLPVPGQDRRPRPPY